ncbi:MAG: FAD-binding oxidoreductase [Janthinobacterium lividum]
MDAQTSLLDALGAIVGAPNVIGPGPEQDPYLTDWRGRYHGQALAVVKPASTNEVASVIRLCTDRGIAIVPQGGNTGMCGAATPLEPRPQVVVRLDRMRAIRAVDAVANTITVEAGCVLAEIQSAAADIGRLFPLSLGAEGSCQIGGNIATNAGGTGVLRYGPTRDQVLGLEAVLPDGRVFDGLRALRKDNTGYDLKHLFIGAEGTLGIITAAVLKLAPAIRSSSSALAMLPDMAAVQSMLALLRDELGDRLGSLEIMSRAQVEVIAEHCPHVAIPFPLDSPFYLVIEAVDTLPDIDLRTPLENALATALDRGLATDALIPESTAQSHALWKVRHSVSEGSKAAGYVVSHDSAVPLGQQAAFVDAATRGIAAAVPEALVVLHGHIGDGNIHILGILPHGTAADLAERARRVALINTAVDDATSLCRGAISAEHGIGVSNIDRLARVTDPVELDLMRRVKAAIDPENLMNPGKIFTAP